MTYDDWKSTEPDHDERTEPEAEERCPDCGAAHDMPCEKDCGCFACRSRATRIQGQPKGDAA